MMQRFCLFSSSVRRSGVEVFNSFFPLGIGSIDGLFGLGVSFCFESIICNDLLAGTV